MSKYYTAKRTRNLYDKSSDEPFKISRSKIDLFLNCARCFYLDRKLGVVRPPGFPFSLNSAVDALLKKEFDSHRAKKSRHPLMAEYGLDAVPANVELINESRENFKGVQYLHKPTNLLVTGAIDDLWVNKKGEYIIVDYKATSKADIINELDQDWHIGYKRQMEIYQWLVRQNGLKVSDTGYFVYCNGQTDRKAFDAKLEFDIRLIPYKGDAAWVPSTLKKIKKLLDGGRVPAAAKDCDYCAYRTAVEKVL